MEILFLMTSKCAILKKIKFVSVTDCIYKFPKKNPIYQLKAFQNIHLSPHFTEVFYESQKMSRSLKTEKH